MPRISATKEVPVEAVQEGRLHIVDFRPTEAVIQDPSLGRDTLIDMLHDGRSVITPEFAPQMSRVKQHDVFPDKTIDERRSAHEVGFGRFTGRKANGRVGHILSVAMKPFGTADKAIDELYGYQVLQTIGVETYKPIGVFPSKEFNNYMVITEKRNELMSLDRDSWVVGRQVRNDADVEVAERNTSTVKEIAGVLAWLHVNGVFHPDGQIKNFAVTDYGKVGVIDPENLGVYPLMHFDTAARQSNDFEKLLKSLITTDNESSSEDKIYGVGMLAGMGERQVRSCVQELLIDPYRQALEQCVYDYGSDIEQATMLDSAAVHLFSQPSWPLHTRATAHS